jgi:hypothetical protein
LTNPEIEPQKNQIPKPNFYKGGLILAGITFIIGLLRWPCMCMLGELTHSLFEGFDTLSFWIFVWIFTVLFIYGSVISIILYRGSISKKKWLQAILRFFALLLIGFYLFALYVGEINILAHGFGG